MTEPNSKPTYRISDLHESDRPRERLESLGPQALTNAELIAILLRVGVQGENAVEVGQRLLNKFGGLNGLHRAPFKELVGQHGLGEAKASQIKAAIELGRRLMLESPGEKPSINSPADAGALVQYEMSALEAEHFGERGGENRTEQFVYGVPASTPRDPTPSPDDVAVTRAIVQAGKLLDVDVLDHLLIGTGKWVSLKGKGLGFV